VIFSLVKPKPIPGKQQAVLDILRFVRERLEMKRGCLASCIYQECDQDPAILYLEQWHTKQEFDRHIQSDVYLRVLNAMDLCREKPQVCFHGVSNTKGMGWIADLRLKNENEPTAL
jgi:quinol monooxygenase YgiN